MPTAAPCRGEFSACCIQIQMEMSQLFDEEKKRYCEVINAKSSAGFYSIDRKESNSRIE